MIVETTTKCYAIRYRWFRMAALACVACALCSCDAHKPLKGREDQISAPAQSNLTNRVATKLTSMSQKEGETITGAVVCIDEVERREGNLQAALQAVHQQQSNNTKSVLGVLARRTSLLEWTDADWQSLIEVLANANSEEKAAFLEYMCALFPKLGALPRAKVLPVISNLVVLGHVSTDALFGNRVLQEAADLYNACDWWPEARGIYLETICAMGNGHAFERWRYLYFQSSVLDTYAAENNYEMAEQYYQKALQSLPDLTPDEKCDLTHAATRMYFTEHTSPVLRIKALERYEAMVNDPTISPKQRKNIEEEYRLVKEALARQSTESVGQ